MVDDRNAEDEEGWYFDYSYHEGLSELVESMTVLGPQIRESRRQARRFAVVRELARRGATSEQIDQLLENSTLTEIDAALYEWGPEFVLPCPLRKICRMAATFR